MNRRDFLEACCIAAFVRAPQVRAFNIATASRLANDPRRPQYHLLPAANWMNDPNGPIYWMGQYHMFYQYNPNGAFWGDMHWAHAVSPDMVHWKHLPIALSPTPGGPDAAGCFSGTAIVDRDRVAMLYTGVVDAPENDATIRDGAHSLRESQCLAIGSGKDLTTWIKDPHPVIAAPPTGMDVAGFRDPRPWRQGDLWYMAVGSGVRGKGGAVLLYKSKDLRQWEYLHVLAGGSGNGVKASNPVDSGEMWECPDFFALGDKHVLIHSAEGKAYWQVGVLDPERLIFVAEKNGVLDYGSFYAPKTQLDQFQNRILWGWIPETRPLAEYRAAGWAGMMSLPRVLTLNRNHELQVQVAPVVEKLREEPKVLRIPEDEKISRRQIAQMSIENCRGEIACSFRRNADRIEISLVANSASGAPLLTCRYDPAHPGEVIVDDQVVPVFGGAEHSLILRFFIDGSVIESFVNGQSAYTKRFYYPGHSAPQVGLQITGKITNLSNLSMWQMSPISSDRLTS